MTFPALRCGGRQLPARRVAQFDRVCPEMQPAAGAGSEIDHPNGILGGQAQTIGRGTAARHDRFAPQCGKRRECLADPGSADTETGLDGAHVYALADAHELAGTGKARQRLVYGRTVSEVKQRTWTQRRGLREAFGTLHDALWEAARGPCLLSRCQNDRGQNTVQRIRNPFPGFPGRTSRRCAAFAARVPRLVTSAVWVVLWPHRGLRPVLLWPRWRFFRVPPAAG